MDRVETQNLKRPESQNFFTLSDGQDSEVTNLSIIDISFRSHFHFIVRSKSATGHETQTELSATERDLEGTDKLSLRTAVLGQTFSWVFTLN